MVKVRQLSRNYGDFKAVDAVSFEVNPGEVVGLLGHNGAGKTTIMKVMTGFLEPTAGSATLDGWDVVRDRREVQRRIGYLPENCPLYPDMTVIDTLEYQAQLQGIPAHQRRLAVRRAIQRTRLEAKAADPIATLSRGYRQRVGVAQAILHSPQVLILDEPTNGLDPEQIQHMRGLIRELATGATLILSTHILQEVQAVCDRVLILRQGRLVLDAPLADLNQSRRLLVALDAGPDRVQPLLARVKGVTGVAHLGQTDGQHRYALDTLDTTATAPTVAQSLLAQGFQLYQLCPEQRDLETLFGEINAPKEVANG